MSCRFNIQGHPLLHLLIGLKGFPSMANHLRIWSIVDWDSDVYFMMKGIGRCCMWTTTQHRALGVWTMEEQQKQLMLSQASGHSWSAILSNWLETFMPFLHTEQNALHIWRQKLLNYTCLLEINAWFYLQTLFVSICYYLLSTNITFFHHTDIIVYPHCKQWNVSSCYLNPMLSQY